MILTGLLGPAVAAPSGPVAAADPVTAGRARAEQGRAAWDAGDFAAAARHFRAADALDPRPAYRYSVAVAREQQGALLEAERILRALTDYPPAVEALPRIEARLLAELPPVRIVGLPAHAAVTLGGAPLGERAPVGTHALTVEHPSIYPHRSTVHIVGGAPVELRPALAPRRTHGAVQLRAGASWRLTLDGEPLDGPGVALRVLPSGEHVLRVVGPDVDGRTPLVVEPGQLLAVEAPVAVDPGSAAGGWLVGGGATGLAAGIGLLIYSRVLDADADAARACAAREDAVGCTLADMRAIEDDAFAAEAGGWIGLGVGLAGLAAGGWLLLADDTLPVRIGPAGVAGRF